MFGQEWLNFYLNIHDNHVGIMCLDHYGEPEVVNLWAPYSNDDGFTRVGMQRRVFTFSSKALQR